MKPTTSYLEDGGKIEVPHNLESLDHEVELAVVIGQKARDVPEASAMDYVGGIIIKLLHFVFLILGNLSSCGLIWYKNLIFKCLVNNCLATIVSII